MNNTIKLICQAAKKLRLPHDYYQEIDLLEIRLGNTPYYFYYTISPLNQGASVIISNDKYHNKILLQQSGFPVAKAVQFKKEDWLTKPLKELIRPLDYPLVVKPIKNTCRGQGVFCKIPEEKQLSDYLQIFFQHFQEVLIEEFHSTLKEYRVLVLNNKIIGVVERIGAHIYGDGKNTIEALMAIKNEEKNRLISHVTVSPLTYDIEYELCLREQQLNLQSIPARGQRVRLCYTANTGRGGDIYSLGKTIHPTNARRLVHAAKALALNFTGLDILCEDINKPFDKNWLIIEANIAPDITIHELAPAGKQITVSRTILWQLIKRHPISYVVHLSRQVHGSLYFKITVAMAFLFLFIFFFSH